MQTAHKHQDVRPRLADHVRACQVDGQVVLLDLRRGRYVGIGGRQAQLLGSAIDDWPAGDQASVAAGQAADAHKLVRPMLAQGLLTYGTASGMSAVSIEQAGHSLNVDEGIAAASAGLPDLCRFLQAAAVAKLWLRWRSMRAIVNAVTNRRARQGRIGCGIDPLQLLPAMATYEKLRPLVLTARDQCLFDSLALINFLAGKRLFPRWIVGVRTSPFRAHSWVQTGDLVLNDLHENVRRFKPILVV
jgi:hypothetical protein